MALPSEWVSPSASWMRLPALRARGLFLREPMPPATQIMDCREERRATVAFESFTPTFGSAENAGVPKKTRKPGVLQLRP